MTISSPPDRPWAIPESGRSIVIAAFVSFEPDKVMAAQLTVKRPVSCG
jgi:hypothetical protein